MYVKQQWHSWICTCPKGLFKFNLQAWGNNSSQYVCELWALMSLLVQIMRQNDNDNMFEFRLWLFWLCSRNFSVFPQVIPLFLSH